MAFSKNDTNQVDDNLETFSIFWLDTEVNNEENRVAQKQLRSIINHLKTFEDPNEFEQCIQQMIEEDRTVLIVSGLLGRKVVPTIHQLRQVSSIYVYCMNKEENEQWAQSYKKVKTSVYLNLFDHTL